MIQIYCGDGKGKTTAAVGLSVRAAGNGFPVLFVQFLKDDSSGEISILKQINGITVMHAKVDYGFVNSMTSEQLEATKMAYDSMISKVGEWLNETVYLDEKDTGYKQDEPCAVVILDEILHACNYGLVSEEELYSMLKKYSARVEFVLTGRNPSAKMKETADYISEIENRKHPYEQGVTARRGIEY